MRTLFIVIALHLLTSCNGVSKGGRTEDAPDVENVTKGSDVVLDTFVKTKFYDRAEELVYIRNYIEYKLPKIIIEAEPKKVEHALEILVGNGKNVTLEEAAKYTWIYRGDYDRLWYSVTEDNLSFAAVKKKLSSYKTLYPKEQQKIEEENKMLPDDTKNDDIVLPPVVNERYDANGKIRGDFNGDGNLEYAFRVLTKKGYGNPLEDGTPDEYEIQFSDITIKPVKVDCCWFQLINEGDLNNDGSDEFSIAQTSMNGCIGSFITFSCKTGNCFELFEPFAFFSCSQESKRELKDLVTLENKVIYYWEIDANGDGFIKKRATLKI